MKHVDLTDQDLGRGLLGSYVSVWLGCALLWYQGQPD